MASVNSVSNLYNSNNICFCGGKIDISRLVDIPNFVRISANGLRGEALSSPKNRKFLYPLSHSGVDTVIDLRGKFGNDKYPEMCSSLGLRYINVPIDSAEINAREIISSLPKLFKTINSENYYMACAMGLHRTDIALALNYLYNPVEQNIPRMIGHFRGGKFKNDDILRRINSINKELTEQDIKAFGWTENFEETFKARKLAFLQFNEQEALKFNP